MTQRDANAPAEGAREMLDQIIDASRRDGSIRARTEGLTWIVWGFVFGGYGLTVALAVAVDGAVFGILWAVFPILWELFGVLATVGIWRSAAVAVRNDISPARAMLFFVGWWLLFVLVERLAGWLDVGAPQHVVTLGTFALLLCGFAFLNPLRYTVRGRATALILGVIAAVAAAVGSALAMDPGLAPAFVALVVGTSWTLGGVLALFRG